MKAEFARRLEARAQIEKDANSKKRGIDLIRPTYAAAPKAGGMKHVKKNKGAHTRYPFSPQQQMVVDMVSAGKSVFFTGSAGTGKSVRKPLDLRFLFLHLPLQLRWIATVGAFLTRTVSQHKQCKEQPIFTIRFTDSPSRDRATSPSRLYLRDGIHRYGRRQHRRYYFASICGA